MPFMAPSAKHPVFPPEVRERVLRRILEHQSWRTVQTKAPESIAAKIVPACETLVNWYLRG
uniref:Transposase n=1 Tax=Ralstonia solanacearum TaxID=305 RepID=A0A0S4TYR9_RALSL